MQPIFHHSDYRDVLREYYAYQKRHTSGFSLRSFAAKSELGSAGFVQAVMEGKKNLGEAAGLQLARGMGLSEEETEHFVDLVRFSRAKTLMLKRQILDQMNSRRRRNDPALLNNADARYLNDWYLPVMREMVQLATFQEDASWIQKNLGFPVSLSEIREGMGYLEKHGFIRRNENGKLYCVEKNVGTGLPEEHSALALAARCYHSQMADLARQALEVFPKDERYASGSTLSFSEEGFLEATKRIRALRYELLELASSDKPNRVYQMALHLFPMTQSESGDKEKP